MSYGSTNRVSTGIYEAPPAVPPETQLQTAMRRLSDVNDQLRNGIDKLGTFNARMLGAVPTEATKAQEQSRSCIVDELNALIGTTTELAGQLHREVNRTFEIA